MCYINFLILIRRIQAEKIGIIFKSGRWLDPDLVDAGVDPGLHRPVIGILNDNYLLAILEQTLAADCSGRG